MIAHAIVARPNALHGAIASALRAGALAAPSPPARPAAPPAAPEPTIRVVPIADIMETRPDPVAWAIDGLVPRNEVTLLAAHGGSGKSILALTWALHAAAGREWAGRYVAVQRVTFVSFEDRAEVLLARVRRIIECYDLPAAALSNVLLLDATDAEPLVVEGVVERVAAAVETPSFRELRELSLWASGGLIVIDNASDAYAGNENARQQVRTFMRSLARLARNLDAAVLLLAHVPKFEVRSKGAGENYSGSTAWHNGARSRLSLIADGPRVELRHEKCQFARPAEPISLQWIDHGVLVPVAAGSPADRAELDADCEHVIAAMRAALMAGVSVGTARTGPTAATATLRTYPAELGADLVRDSTRLWRALNRLEAAGRIERVTVRTQDRKVREHYRLRRTGAEPAHGGDA
jgi:KaiC/GvpD/RAD55 family RecA-like ATPase